MPPANTDGAVYLDKAAEVDRFLSEISDVKELALDTEGASFHRFLDRIYLLQISTRKESAIIDPLPIGSPAGLGQLLESKAVEVVFHDADYFDCRILLAPAEAEVFPDGVLAGEQLARKGLVDESDGRRVGSITRIDVPAREKARAGGL